jgi:hypothetical protein
VNDHFGRDLKHVRPHRLVAAATTLTDDHKCKVKQQCGWPCRLRFILNLLNSISMNYALQVHDMQVGPFLTHIAATVFAEQNGYDDYRMVELYDPAEAPGIIARLKKND